VKKIDIEAIIDIGAEFNMIPVSDYIGANKPLIWECPKKHQFNRPYSAIKRDGLICRKCTPKIPHNKGRPSSLSTRIKLSVLNQGIKEEEFNGFTSSPSKALRNKLLEQKINIACFEKYNYTCDVCLIRGVALNAHHLNSWKWFPEQRFSVDNLVCLCTGCHKKFHKIYGNGKKNPNTRDEYIEFKATAMAYVKI
jgi:hypothetical protein